MLVREAKALPLYAGVKVKDSAQAPELYGHQGQVLAVVGQVTDRDGYHLILECEDEHVLYARPQFVETRP